jgi:hypothetical protein
MPDDLKTLIDKAKLVRMTPKQKEEQRQSFAYGNTKIENPRITRKTVKTAAEAIKRDDD